MSKTGVIVQARTTSIRFPNKIFQKLDEDNTVLSFLMKTLKNCKAIDAIILAVPEDQLGHFLHFGSLDDKIHIFGGDENNVLKRFYDASKKFNLQTIVRITSDCPLIKKEMIEKIVDEFDSSGVDYLTNYSLGGTSSKNPDNYISDTSTPDGFCLEVFDFSCLKAAYDGATDPYDLEHVTPWMRRKRSGKTISTGTPTIVGKFSIDTPQDLSDVIILKRWIEEGKVKFS